MTEQINPLPPSMAPEQYEYFAFVVEGEVAVIMPVLAQSMEAHVAAWSSDPKVVRLTQEQKNVVQSGWTFDGQTFNPPQE